MRSTFAWRGNRGRFMGTLAASATLLPMLWLGAVGCTRANAVSQDAGNVRPAAPPAAGWGATYTAQVLGAG